MKLKSRIKKKLSLGIDAKDTLLSSHMGHSQSGTILTFFAHWDKNNIIAPYVLSYLEELNKNDCEIVFITSSPDLSKSDLEKLKNLCSKIIFRSNYGLDFGSYKLGFDLNKNPSKKYRGYLFANDSVLGPFKPLNEIFEILNKEKDAVLGLTDSFEISHHLQSYFLYFPQKIFDSAPVKNFFKNIKALGIKKFIIEKYEVGLSKKLLTNQIKIEAIYPISNSIEEAKKMGKGFEFRDRLEKNHNLNPTLHFWQILYENFSFPFIKRELFTTNQINSKHVESLKIELSKSDDTFQKNLLTYIKN